MSQICMLYTYTQDSDLPDYIAKKADIFHPLKMKTNVFYESEMYRMQLSRPIDDINYVGHVAYSYQKKIRPYSFEKLVQQYGETNDIITLLNAPMHDLYTFAETYHPGFLDIWKLLIEKLGYGDYTKYGVPLAFYCNYWIMKKDAFLKYKEFATRAMDLLINDPTLSDLCYRDSGYKGTISMLSEEALMAISGKPYYTFHPFIMERLVCFFVHVNNMKVKQIGYSDNEPLDDYTGYVAPQGIYVTSKKKNQLL